MRGAHEGRRSWAAGAQGGAPSGQTCAYRDGGRGGSLLPSPSSYVPAVSGSGEVRTRCRSPRKSRLAVGPDGQAVSAVQGTAGAQGRAQTRCLGRPQEGRGSCTWLRGSGRGLGATACGSCWAARSRPLPLQAPVPSGNVPLHVTSGFLVPQKVFLLPAWGFRSSCVHFAQFELGSGDVCLPNTADPCSPRMWPS